MTRKKLSAFAIFLMLILIVSIPASAYNQEFHFSFTSNGQGSKMSAKSARKDDHTPRAYVTLRSGSPAMNNYQAQIAVRVRNSSHSYATYHTTLTRRDMNSTKTISYLSGQNIPGRTYYFYGSLDHASYFPATAGGMWCP